MISERITDYIPPKMKSLNMINPILMHVCSFVSKLYKAASHPTKCDVINDIKLFPTVYRCYTVAFFCRFPIRHRVTKSSALEFVVFRHGCVGLQRKFRVVMYMSVFAVSSLACGFLVRLTCFS